MDSSSHDQDLSMGTPVSSSPAPFFNLSFIYGFMVYWMVALFVITGAFFVGDLFLSLSEGAANNHVVSNGANLLFCLLTSSAVFYFIVIRETGKKADRETDTE